MPVVSFEYIKKYEALRTENERLTGVLAKDKICGEALLADNARLTAEIKEAREILAGTAVGSLPNDYPLSRLAIETWNTLQLRTTEGLALIGKIEGLTARVEELEANLRWIDQQRYTDRQTINHDNAFEMAGKLNKKLLEIMDRARAALTQPKETADE